MDREMDDVREELESTRDRLSETFDVLSYTTPVRKRIRRAVTGSIERARASGMIPPKVHEHPVALFVTGAAIGFTVGMLLPIGQRGAHD